MLALQTTIVAPIDIMIMSLYPRFAFVCVYDDIIIADDRESDICSTHMRQHQQTNPWSWKLEEYAFSSK